MQIKREAPKTLLQILHENSWLPNEYGLGKRTFNDPYPFGIVEESMVEYMVPVARIEYETIRRWFYALPTVAYFFGRYARHKLGILMGNKKLNPDFGYFDFVQNTPNIWDEARVWKVTTASLISGAEGLYTLEHPIRGGSMCIALRRQIPLCTSICSTTELESAMHIRVA